MAKDRSAYPVWMRGPGDAALRSAWDIVQAARAEREPEPPPARTEQTDEQRLRAELDDHKRQLAQARQDEARITHEWDQARMAIERMGRILDGGDA